MAETSKIEWTDATWNPITGCSLVSEGCRHCYAARLAATRLRHHPSRAGLARLNAAGEAKFTGEVRLNEQWLDQPLRWRRPRRIFVCAHGDLFHEAVPDDWIDRVFAVMALAPQHTFQVLTKRPERARDYAFRRDHNRHHPAMDYAAIMAFTGQWNTPALDLLSGWPLPNVWLGTSVEDQPTADARIPHLLATPAAVRFVSAEPLLGTVDLTRWSGLHDDSDFGLDWVIAGGESGPHARPMHPDWARSLRDQCSAAGVAFFFKQWGEWRPLNDGECVRNWMLMDSNGILDLPDGRWPQKAEGEVAMRRVGKTLSGRLLDGRTHDAIPDPTMEQNETGNVERRPARIGTDDASC